MSRTTLNIDDNVLRELKRRSRSEGKPLGQLASELLIGALAESERSAETEVFRLPTFDGGVPRVDLDDKEALRRVLDA